MKKPAARVDPWEKKLAVIGLRAPESVVAWVDEQAVSLGLTRSQYLLTLIGREIARQGLPCEHELLTDLREAIGEAVLAIKDGRIDATERQRITKPVARGLNRLWNRETA